MGIILQGAKRLEKMISAPAETDPSPLKEIIHPGPCIPFSHLVKGLEGPAFPVR